MNHWPYENTAHEREHSRDEEWQHAKLELPVDPKCNHCGAPLPWGGLCKCWLKEAGVHESVSTGGLAASLIICGASAALVVVGIVWLVMWIWG